MRANEAWRRGAAWRDLSSRGRLRATGEDRVRLLHAISSNDVDGLASGEATYAFFLNAQGRIQADSHIFVDRDQVLIDCEASAADTLREHIESYIIMDDVTLEDLAPSTALLALTGPKASETVAALRLPTPSRALTFERSNNVAVVRTPTPSVDYWIMAPAGERPGLVDAIRRAGTVEATEREWEARRVRHWVPRFGVDFGPTNIPHETRQFNAVSFSKGCYTGQEIVERVRSRGRVRRQLVGVELDSAQTPADLAIRHNGRDVGNLTSPTPCPGQSAPARGFAIVRSGAATPGTRVEVGRMPATVFDVSRK